MSSQMVEKRGMILSRVITKIGLGQAACKIGLHEWVFGVATDQHLNVLEHYTYCWCARKDCDQPTVCVDLERRVMR